LEQLPESMEKYPIEPFSRFAAFMTRYATAEGFIHERFVPPQHIPAVREAAREMGVIYHDDGTLELVKQ